MKTMKMALLCLFSLSAFSGYAQDKKESVLQWESKRHNMGQRAQYDAFEVEYRFTNTSEQPIIILGADVTCECTTTFPPKEPILPGQQGVIKAHFDAKLLGKFKKPIMVSHTGEDFATVLLLECEILAEKDEE